VTGPSDEALRAIAHPARRAMLRLVWDAERPASELAEAAGLTRPAASQHLKQLREAGQVASFLAEFWAGPLQRLRDAAEADAATSSRRAEGTS
jgi:DNA-binding transcriptional ArsR family regulator